MMRKELVGWSMDDTHSPVAIVTGAGSGIGREIAKLLAMRGYRVALVGRRLDALDETGEMLGDGAWVSIQADVGVSAHREQIVHKAINAFGRIDAVVNNAGFGAMGRLGEMSLETIEEVFAVNAIGAIDLVRLALPELIKRKGCVVNIASIAIVDPFDGLGVYGCAKSALDGLTRCVHNEYHQQGVRAFTIAPGAVETAMLRSIVSRDDLPTAMTLTPLSVAEKTVSCVLGECDEPSGTTLMMESPS